MVITFPVIVLKSNPDSKYPMNVFLAKEPLWMCNRSKYHALLNLTPHRIQTFIPDGTKAFGITLKLHYTGLMRSQWHYLHLTSWQPSKKSLL